MVNMLYRLDEIEEQLKRLELSIKSASIYLNTLAQLLIDNGVCTPEELVEMLAEKTEIIDGDNQ